MSLAGMRGFDSSGLCRETGRGWVFVVMVLEAFDLCGGGEGGEFRPFTAVKAEARCSPVLSLKKPVLINGACTIDGMAGRRGAGATQSAVLTTAFVG